MYQGRNVSSTVVTDDINKCDSSKKQWLTAVNQYEQDFRDSIETGGRVRKSRDYGIKFGSVTAKTEEDNIFEEDQGIIWPEPVFAISKYATDPKYKEEFKDWKNMLADRKVGEGRVVRGILLGSSYGSDPGCIKHSKRSKQGHKIEEEKGNTEQGHTSASMRHMFQRQLPHLILI